MKKMIKKFTIGFIALGIVLNLIPLNIHISDNTKNKQEIKYSSDDEHIYPGGKSIQIINL